MRSPVIGFSWSKPAPRQVPLIKLLESDLKVWGTLHRAETCIVVQEGYMSAVVPVKLVDYDPAIAGVL